MRSLLDKLSGLDAAAARAVQVIASFDELVAHEASVEALVRTAAILADCPAGIALTGRPPVRFDTLGRRITQPRRRSVIEADVIVADELAARVWLEHEGEPGELDEIILERMGIAAARILERSRARTGVVEPDPSAIDALLDTRTSPPDVARAARILRLDPNQPVHVVVVKSADDLAHHAGLVVGCLRPQGPAAWTTVDETAVIIAATVSREVTLGGPGRRVGIGPSRALVRVPDSYAAASVALRFARPGGPDVWHTDLGIRSLLATIPPDAVRIDRDAQAIGRLATGPSDLNDLMILDAVCSAGTLRAAAAVLHLHHSSISHRLRNIEAVLGFAVSAPEGRFRAQLAIELWQLAHLSEEAERS